MTNHADKQTLLSVIVPVYNEAQTIREILAQVRAVDLFLGEGGMRVDLPITDLLPHACRPWRARCGPSRRAAR